MASRAEVVQVDTVDVDPAVKPIAEKYFLQKNLNQKIHFIPQSARGFLKEAITQDSFYDSVLVDAYIGTSMPEELLTYEFFSDLTKVSSYIMLNMIMDTALTSELSQHTFATLRAARGDIRYKNVSLSPGPQSNFLIASRPFSGAVHYTEKNTTAIYTDNKQSVEIDKAAMLYGR
ncbi:hypothetical protein KBC03_00685 [Patescibacteria group bacterium]|nr:hypothetical protein [Patescibacteria group bacterium]